MEECKRNITYFIEVNKIQIYPIRSLIVTHYSVWSILHNYPKCWQTIWSVKVNKLQVALWDTAQHLQILGLGSIARHQCLEAKYIFSCGWIDVLQLKFLENYTPNYLNTFKFKWIFANQSITCRQTIVKYYGSMKCQKYK